MENETPPQESRGGQHLIPLFSEMSEAQLDKLKGNIEKNDGHVICFIHPYYNKAANIQYGSKKVNEKRYAAMQAGFKALVEDGTRHTPLFIFEENSKIEKLKKTLGKFTNINPLTYIVATQSRDAEPTYHDASGQQGWIPFKEIFKKLGVQAVEIGGANLTYTGTVDQNKSAAEQFPEIFPNELAYLRKEGIPKHIGKPRFYECVAIAIVKLYKDFEVFLSDYTYPHGNQEYRKHQGK